MKVEKDNKRRLAVSKYGVGIIYRCNSEVFEYGKKCARRDCNRCKDSVAEMSSKDAAKLLMSYKKKMKVCDPWVL